MGRAALGDKGRDDGVVGFFARLQAIGVLGVQGKIRAPVLQGNARVAHHNAGAEAHIVALDVGNHVVLCVGCAQIDRAAFGQLHRRGQGGLAGDLAGAAAPKAGSRKLW